MSDDLTYRVYAHAMGLGEAMTKSASGVEELVSIAGGDREVLEGALRRAESEAIEEADRPEEPTSAPESDAPISDAPALLARRLLADALEQVTTAQS